MEVNGYTIKPSANLQGADLRLTILRGANLQHANLQSADLRYANLRRARLWDADLQFASLQHADLRSADLRRANLPEQVYDTDNLPEHLPETTQLKLATLLVQGEGWIDGVGGWLNSRHVWVEQENDNGNDTREES